MSTAHRPTWAPAKGGEEQGGARWHVPSIQRSALNLAAHTKLKFRQEGQGAQDELSKQTKEDLRAALEEKERKHQIKTKGINFEEERKKDLLLLEQGADASGGKKAAALIPKAADADDEDEEDEESSDDDDDDEDDEEELMRELERIKKERAEEAAKKAAEEAAKAHKEKEKELMTGNPLLGLAGGGQDAPSFAIKRRWDDDVVFKNQARSEPKSQKRFINDTIRNDFHKRFLTKYVR